MLMDSLPPPKKRTSAIDQFRGFAIIGMVLVNYAADIRSIPAWFKHAPDIGLTFADLIAPFFIFAIGLTYGLSFRRRLEREGAFATIGLGAVISAGENLLGYSSSRMDWGALQAIGCAGLLTLLVIFLPAWLRLVIGLGLLTGYQLLLNAFWLDTVLHSSHGGLLGALSWSAMLIIATVFGDLFQRESTRKYFPYFSAMFLVAGFTLALVVPLSKNRVSASYDLFSLGVSGLVFTVFYLAKFKSNFFSAWGRNPILLYCLSYLVIALFVLPGIPAWHIEAPLWLAGLQALSMITILGALALHWQKRDFVFSI
jgi:predicted acyltransferase